MTCFDKVTGPCAHKAQTGTSALCAAILSREFDAVAFNGIYNCRPPRGAASGFSAHAEGRAFDLNARLPQGGPDPAPVKPGSAADIALRHWMQTMSQLHEQLGVQRMIYKDTEWRCDRGFFKASSGLAAMHQNHLHTEQNRTGATTLTRAQVERILSEGDDDMFSDADRALVKETNDLLKKWFDTNGDMRKKQDAIYVEVADEDHADTLGGRVKKIEGAVIT